MTFLEIMGKYRILDENLWGLYVPTLTNISLVSFALSAQTQLSMAIHSPCDLMRFVHLIYVFNVLSQRDGQNVFQRKVTTTRKANVWEGQSEKSLLNTDWAGNTAELLYSWACLLMLVVYGINIGYNIEYQNIK